MKWKSTNVEYLAGIGIPLAVIAAFGIKAAWPSTWKVLLILAVTLLLFAALIRKLRHLPRPKWEYRDLQPLSLELPVDYGVELYTCKRMNQYDFIMRIVELLSPFAFRGSRPKVVVNPVLLEQKGETFIKIAVMREVERYRKRYQVRTVLCLLLPVLLAAALVLGVFAFEIPVGNYLNAFVLQFILPFLFTILFVGHLVFWNKSLSKKDYKLDSFLASCFPVEEVKQYILAVEELEGRNEKEKHSSLNRHYTNQRIQELENMKKGV